MKGTIVQCLEELISTRFGKDTWEQALNNAGLKTPVMFLPFQDVDDAVVMQVVTAVCDLLNLSLPQAADAFGEYWVMEYSQRMYPQYYYTKCKTAKEFLLKMDAVHVSMTKNLKDARPPRFEYEWKNENTLIMRYKSHRPLLDFVVGLAKGVGEFYNEKLTVTKIEPDKVQIVF
jgi:hypothetical protein